MNRRAFIAALAAGLHGQSLRMGRTVTGRPAPVARYVPFVGQSLSAGGLGGPAVTTTQPYTNRTFVGGTILGDGFTPLPPVASIASLVPLREGITQNQESPCSGFGNEIGYRARQAGRGAGLDMVTASWGKSGQIYDNIKKGTNPYQYSLDSVTKAKELLGGVIVPALMCVHGESDGSCGYAQKVAGWQADYEADIKAITGQQGRIPMFISQPLVGECNAAGNPRPPYFYDGMLGLYEQRGVNLQPNPEFIMVCPKYQFPPVTFVNRPHLTPLGYRWLGEYYAKAYWKVIVLGQQWDCLRPISLSVSGNVISITFTVPVPPLVFDTTQVTNPGNFGFSYADNGITITNVAITNDGTGTGIGVVQLTLSANPINTANITVEYAGGVMSEPRGNLRDSDPTVSGTGNNLYNWCVHFAKKSTFTCCPGTA